MVVWATQNLVCLRVEVVLAVAGDDGHEVDLGVGEAGRDQTNGGRSAQHSGSLFIN